MNTTYHHTSLAPVTDPLIFWSSAPEYPSGSLINMNMTAYWSDGVRLVLINGTSHHITSHSITSQDQPLTGKRHDKHPSNSPLSAFFSFRLHEFCIRQPSTLPATLERESHECPICTDDLRKWIITHLMRWEDSVEVNAAGCLDAHRNLCTIAIKSTYTFPL